MLLILNSQRPFLTTWYTFGKGGTLFATKLYRGGVHGTILVAKIVVVVPLFQLENKKGGGGGGGGQKGKDFRKGDCFREGGGRGGGN